MPIIGGTADENSAASFRPGLAKIGHTGMACQFPCVSLVGKAPYQAATWRGATRAKNHYSFARRRMILPYQNPDDPERIAEGLHKAGLDALREMN